MPAYFFDTSAPVKFYHDEDGSDEVRTVIRGLGSETYISRLALVEMLSAFAGKTGSRGLKWWLGRGQSSKVSTVF